MSTVLPNPSGPPAEATFSLETGPLVGTRYRRGYSIGKGGGGEVYGGVDLHSGEEVALKRLHNARDPRVQRELQALGRLRLPGVVRLRDVIHEDDETWLVMDRIHGQTFPGDLPLAPAERWTALLPRLRSLLRTLEAMHQAGIVHRDLKPENILVTGAGEPVLLDFGLARGQDLASTVTRNGAVVGTPRYMAPEIFLGGRADVRSDLYALGLMLYEALVGELPWRSDRMEAMLASRTHVEPPPLATKVAGLPRPASDLVDALLRRDPARRPQSAAACLEELGERGAERLPWLGSRAPIEALCAAARQGQRGVVLGPPGSGRTRCLREAMSILEAEGLTCVQLPPGSAPYESLAPLLAASVRLQGPDAVNQGLAELRQGGGPVICVDGARRLDRWSRRALESLGGPAMWTMDPGEAPGHELRPLDAAALTGLVHGPELILHLPEDATQLLLRRTGGLPLRIEAELRSWVQANLARWEEGKLRITRGDLDRLSRHGSPLLPDGPALEAALDELLGCILLASPDLRVEELSLGLNEPRWRVDMELDALEEAGALRREGSFLFPLRASRAAANWSAEHRRKLAGGLCTALEADPGRRLSLMLRESVVESLPEVAAEAANLRWLRGDDAQALADLLSSAELEPLREADPRAVWMVRLAIDLRTADALARAGAALVPGPYRELLRLADNIRLGQVEAIEGLRALGEQAEPALENLRADLLVRGARLASAAEEAVVVAELAPRIGGAWAERWRGRLAYRQRRFLDAAAHHEAAAARWTAIGPQLEDLLYAASARMEVGDLEGTERLVEGQALPMAVQLRLAFAEARARLYLRLCRLRRDPPAESSPEWVQAIAALGDAWLLGIVTVNEAGLAWRAGRTDEGRALARQAFHAARQARDAATATYAEAIGLCLGERLDREPAQVLEAALGCGAPDIVLDVAALLGPGSPRPDLRRSLEGPSRELSHRPRSARHGIFSLDEVETRLGGITDGDGVAR